MSDENTVYRQGANAYMSGESVDDNPYPEGSIAYVWWDRAFKEENSFWLDEQAKRK